MATPENKIGMEYIQKNCQREPTLVTPGFQTSSLQMTQRINLCGLKHPGCGTLLQQPWKLEEKLTTYSEKHCSGGLSAPGGEIFVCYVKNG